MERGLVSNARRQCFKSSLAPVCVLKLFCRGTHNTLEVRPDEVEPATHHQVGSYAKQTTSPSPTSPGSSQTLCRVIALGRSCGPRAALVLKALVAALRASAPPQVTFANPNPLGDAQFHCELMKVTYIKHTLTSYSSNLPRRGKHGKDAIYFVPPYDRLNVNPTSNIKTAFCTVWVESVPVRS